MKEERKEARKQRSKEARKQGSKEARKQGSKEARKQGRKEARKEGIGRKEGRKERRKKRRKERKKKGRKDQEGRTEGRGEFYRLDRFVFDLLRHQKNVILSDDRSMKICISNRKSRFSFQPIGSSNYTGLVITSFLKCTLYSPLRHVIKLVN